MKRVDVWVEGFVWRRWVLELKNFVDERFVIAYHNTFGCMREVAILEQSNKET
jgi:hypothetical protein